MALPDRFKIEQADARWRSPEPVDYLYADIWDKLGAAESRRRHACDVPQPGRNRPGIGAWRPISSLCWLATGAKPPVTRPQFRAWASILGVPIAAYANRAWLSRIPDIATQMVFGCSPGLNVSASG